MQLLKAFSLIVVMAGVGLAASMPPAILKRDDLQNRGDVVEGSKYHKCQTPLIYLPFRGGLKQKAETDLAPRLRLAHDSRKDLTRILS